MASIAGISVTALYESGDNALFLSGFFDATRADFISWSRSTAFK
jgi:hypothetical protein